MDKLAPKLIVPCSALDDLEQKFQLIHDLVFVVLKPGFVNYGRHFVLRFVSLGQFLEGFVSLAFLENLIDLFLEIDKCDFFLCILLEGAKY